MNTNQQRAIQVFEYFECSLKNLVEGRDKSDLIYAFCKNLILGIALKETLSTETDMHFSFLFSISKASDSESDSFIDAVYLLSSQEVKALIQYFHYRDVVTDHWVEIPRREVFLAMKDKEFYHPQEGHKLTSEEYHQIVFPYFVPTPGFIEVWEVKS